MTQHTPRWIIVEHVADPQGPARIARAYEIIEREAARARAERQAAVVPDKPDDPQTGALTP